MKDAFAYFMPSSRLRQSAGELLCTSITAIDFILPILRKIVSLTASSLKDGGKAPMQAGVCPASFKNKGKKV